MEPSMHRISIIAGSLPFTLLMGQVLVPDAGIQVDVALLLQAALCKLMTEPDIDAEEVLAQLRPTLTKDQASFMLALRGLMAHGILQHCLQKRHRVEYGVFRYAAGAAAGATNIANSCRIVVCTFA
jgi:hypothetical protein